MRSHDLNCLLDEPDPGRERRALKKAREKRGAPTFRKRPGEDTEGPEAPEEGPEEEGPDTQLSQTLMRVNDAGIIVAR